MWINLLGSTGKIHGATLLYWYQWLVAEACSKPLATQTNLSRNPVQNYDACVHLFGTLNFLKSLFIQLCLFSCKCIVPLAKCGEHHRTAEPL